MNIVRYFTLVALAAAALGVTACAKKEILLRRPRRHQRLVTPNKVSTLGGFTPASVGSEAGFFLWNADKPGIGQKKAPIQLNRFGDPDSSIDLDVHRSTRLKK